MLMLISPRSSCFVYVRRYAQSEADQSQNVCKSGFTAFVASLGTIEFLNQ